MRPKFLTQVMLVMVMAGSAFATTHLVPQEHSSIQAAINVCSNYDTVLVAPGKYSGPGNYNINMRGKAITVTSTDPNNPDVVAATIIDCDGKASAFVFYTGETEYSRVKGFTIKNGLGFTGGGIYCFNNSSPSISNCVITKNFAMLGGGICINSGSRPKIYNCSIINNSAYLGGGGIYCNSANPTIVNCLISGNKADDGDGGAVYSHNPGIPVIRSCTITDNYAAKSAGGIYAYSSSNVTVSNSILWGNTAGYAPEILVAKNGVETAVSIEYCNIQDPNVKVVREQGCTLNYGQGNISQTPDFVAEGSIDSQIYIAGDYHLIKESPCVDTGDPQLVLMPSETDIDGNPRIQGERIDIGADEVMMPVSITVKATPRTLNTESKGNWINCILEVPVGYEIVDIVLDSIKLNDEIGPEWTAYEDEKLVVKFSRSEVQAMAGDSEELLLIVTGTLINNSAGFEGSDTINILQKGSNEAKVCKNGKK
ncbi:MAG: right-handed parallel beta-helix repeat-containing protein [Planctomycetota bacterium]|jgi:parallel beta-helix repeat protein